ncbi:MAG: FAD-dependent oxidoreductase [Streptosporangiaceae bacterium]
MDQPGGDGPDYVLVMDDGRELRGDRLLVATGRRPRVAGLGLETGGATFDERGVKVDGQLRAGERLWAIGDVTGVRLLTHVGKYQGEVAAANILGEPCEANSRPRWPSGATSRSSRCATSSSRSPPSRRSTSPA